LLIWRQSGVVEEVAIDQASPPQFSERPQCVVSVYLEVTCAELSRLCADVLEDGLQ